MQSEAISDLVGFSVGLAVLGAALYGWVKGSFGRDTRKGAPRRFWLSAVYLSLAGVALTAVAASFLLSPPSAPARRAVTGVGSAVVGLVLLARSLRACVVGDVFERGVYRDESPGQFWFLVAVLAVAGGSWLWLGVLRLV